MTRMAKQGSPMNILEVGTDKGGITIREDELPLVTAAHLKQLRMTRAVLHRCFAEGVKLMQEHEVTEADRVRPCADETLDGKWEVNLVGYSQFTDPLMQGRRKKGRRSH